MDPCNCPLSTNIQGVHGLKLLVLAAVMPLLVVGTDSYIEADMVERLKVRRQQQKHVRVSLSAHPGVAHTR
jgi:hypothetical protein